VQRRAFFLPADRPAGGQRFCLFHAPRGGTAKGSLVYVPPFAEEMNKSRRMAALQSRVFADAGYAVLQIDLLGCGDSSGDFGDATWSDWVDDVLLACRWLRSRPVGPLWLWGLRAGCLLAAEAAGRLEQPSRLLFWQPTPSGKPVLQQFLRLQTAAELLSGTVKGGVEALRAKLAAGELVEVAGYRIAAALASGLERAELTPCGNVERLQWLEVSTRSEATLGPASLRAVERWQAAGCAVEARVVHGPAFWQTTEIEDAPALLPASLAALQREPVAA
jgi:exosortase A-associated hydrolase 2